MDVARVVNRWTARERNLSVLYHVRFWTSILRRSGRVISIRAGEESIDAATVPAYVKQTYGISDDQRNVLQALDEVAPRIALEEEYIEVELRPDENSSDEDESEGEDDNDDD